MSEDLQSEFEAEAVGEKLLKHLCDWEWYLVLVRILLFLECYVRVHYLGKLFNSESSGLGLQDALANRGGSALPGLARPVRCSRKRLLGEEAQRGASEN